jgi:NAD(P)-dependent dehydrogenase (short-subunit alcohol dehydrogenase family)
MNRLLRTGIGVAAGGTLGWLITKKLLGLTRRIEFTNRVVLITGGSRGLGLVMARQLADQKARIAICSRDADELARAAGDLRARGAEVVMHPCDVTQPQQVRELVSHVRESLGPIDVLINNAGVIQVGPLETMTIEDFEQAMATHFWGPVHTIRETLPEMRRRRFGRIVNIASFGGELAVPHLVPYCASKFALVGFSRGIRVSLAREGVYVTTVCPGLMRTGSSRNAMFKGRHRAEYAWFSIGGGIPLVSIDVERAASHILEASRHGRSDLILTLPAKILARVGHLVPELTAEVLGGVDRLLPGPGGIGTCELPGHESESAWSPSWATSLNDQAALENNEISPDELPRSTADSP